LITDPLFYAAAIPALLITGISKAGFGSGLGILAVPLIALTMPATQAAAIMLPILCVMDLAALWAYRGQWSRENMKIMLPGGLAGIVLGALTFRYVSEAGLKLMLGAVAIGFLLQRWISASSQLERATPTPGFLRVHQHPRPRRRSAFVHLPAAAENGQGAAGRHHGGVFHDHELRQAHSLYPARAVRQP
jgi:uncharacterized membrane protein YfcA